MGIWRLNVATVKEQFFYHEEGSEATINYKDGVREGLSTRWFPNGERKRSEQNYKNGKLVEGSEKFWNYKGKSVNSLQETYE